MCDPFPLDIFIGCVVEKSKKDWRLNALLTADFLGPSRLILDHGSHTVCIKAMGHEE